MAITIDFDASKLNRKLLEYAAVTNQDTKKVTKEEMGLLVQRLIQLTPPPHANKGAAAAKAQGENAIAKDLGRLFVGMDRGAVKSFEDKFGNRFIEGEFIGRSGVYGTESLIFNSSGSGIRDHHQRFRTKRGRVTRAGTFTRNIGRWKFVDKMYIAESDYKKYLKSIQAKVGRAKAGWMAAAKEFGTKAIPQFVKRHPDTDGDKRTRETPHGITLSAINRNKAIGTLNNEARIVRNAMLGRLRDLTSKLNRVLKRGAAKFNRK